MENIDLLLHARWILPIAPQNVILENYALAVRGDRIVGLAPSKEAEQKWLPQTQVRLSSHALMPGFINAHTHVAMNLFRGLADDLPLMDWLQQHIWPAEQALLNEQVVADGTNFAILEMIRGGTTCFCEHYFFHEATAKTAIAAGIRSCVGMWVGNVPTVWGQNEAEYFAKIEATLKNNSPHPLIRWALAPHSPHMVSEDAFYKLNDLSKNYNMPIHIHLHESEPEIEWGLKKYNKRPITWLADLGLLNSQLIGVHMTQITPEEIALVKSNNVPIVHCPESNMKLTSGLAPIQQFLEAGVTVALGTDGAASNNDLDMFGEMRTAALLGKALNSPTAIPAPTALEMATINGAKAFGWDHEIGSLEIGKAADMIAINLDSYLTQPVYNAISQLVYATNRLQVSDVWVAGKQLLKSGEFTQMDVPAILDQAKKITQKAMPFRSKASS